MSDFFSPFFSNFYRSEGSNESEILSLMSSFPKPISDLHSDDLRAVCSKLHNDFRHAFNPNWNWETQKNRLEHLIQIQKLAGQLQEHLAQVEHSTYNGSRCFSTEWNMAIHGFDIIDTKTGEKFVVPKNSINDRPYPSDTIFALERIADDVHRSLSSRKPSGRPKESYLEQTAYSLVRTWTAVSLMRGQSLSTSFPDAKNGGYRWASSIIDKISSRTIIPDNKLGRRSDPVLSRKLGEGVKSLRNRLIALPYCEPAEEWNDLDWKSFAGLDVLFRATSPPGRDCFLRPDMIVDEYYDTWRSYHRQDTEPPIDGLEEDGV